MCIRDRATTVEEVEVMVRDTPITVTEEMETVVRDTPGDQPDKPIQKEDMSMQEMLRIIMEKMTVTGKHLTRKLTVTVKHLTRKWTVTVKRLTRKWIVTKKS